QHGTDEAMRRVPHTWSEPVMEKFSEVLNFGGLHTVQGQRQYRSLFGLNARTSRGLRPLRLALRSLFKEFSITARPIPKLCYDISAKLIKGDQIEWICPAIFSSGLPKSRLLTSYSAVLSMLSDGNNAEIEPRRIQAALEELHDQGYVVFFPSTEMSTANQGTNDDSTLVIIDTSWFCNKLVGSLLGTHLKDEPRRRCPWVWDKEDIKKMLRRQRCEERHLDEILRYLQHLELCTTLDIVPGHPKGHLLFPALVKQDVIQYPVLMSANDAMATAFFGRRLRCTDSSIHLIPFGVFTRLQVKLHKKYCPKNPSFHLGYGWASFMTGNVGVVVRFGGRNKQYIDILIFCPNSNGGACITMCIGTPSYITGNKLMDEIRAPANQQYMEESQQ
ncbi:hypothetical protein GOP47_0017825, partial [Adiantum capillus-veneris]